MGSHPKVAVVLVAVCCACLGTAAANGKRTSNQVTTPLRILEQPDSHGIVLAAPHRTALQSTTALPPPTANEVIALYSAVGRELLALDQAEGMNATLDLWPRYRWIRIFDGVMTPESRMRTTVLLQRLFQDIRTAKDRQSSP